MLSFALVPFINKATRIYKESNTLIDNIWSNSISDITELHIISWFVFVTLLMKLANT